MKLYTINPQLDFWANTLLIIGSLSLVFFGFLIYQRYNPQQLAFNINEAKAVTSESISNLEPTSIQINSINLSLPITEAEIKNNKWQASPNSVTHLISSVVPGEKGNSILYGHNWPNLLGNLKNVKPGDKLTIIYSNNSSKEFEIEYTAKVSPAETSILKNSEDAKITLYTCTGFLDSQRFVVVAKII